MKNFFTFSFFKLTFIALPLFPLVVLGQQGSLGDCRWLNPNPSPGNVETYHIVWSALGTGNSDQEVTFQPPTATDGNGWDLASAKVVSTDMTGTWSITKNNLGYIIFSYTDPVSDGQYAVIEVSATHDGVSDSMNSGTTNVVPGASSCNNVLYYNTGVQPITLSSFEAWGVNTTTRLQWVTASEQNSSHYELQASKDGSHFEQIASVNSLADEYGNSEKSLTYTYIDEIGAMRGQKVFYRLKQVDLNGEYSYTDVLMVDFERAHNNSAASPNPVPIGETLSVLGEYIIQVQLIDAIGQKVYSRDYSTAVHSAIIPTQDLTPGIYFLFLNGKEKISVIVQ